MRATHSPRILLLYGLLRDRSFSRLMTEEAARVLTRLVAVTYASLVMTNCEAFATVRGNRPSAFSA